MSNIHTPSGIAYGRTVAAMVNGKPVQVTRLNDNWLRIEPDPQPRFWSALYQQQPTPDTGAC
jgi:hypothetical protein